MKRRVWHLLLFIILIVIDQVSKLLAKTIIREKGPFSLIPKTLKFQYHENDGAVWGILGGRISFLIILTIFMTLFLLYFYYKIPSGKRYQPLSITWIALIAGAIGNLIDRVRLGYVVDFIYFELIDFPIFNFADMCLTVSSAFLFLMLIFYYKGDELEFIDKMLSFKKKKKKQKK